MMSKAYFWTMFSAVLAAPLIAVLFLISYDHALKSDLREYREAEFAYIQYLDLQKLKDDNAERDFDTKAEHEELEARKSGGANAWDQARIKNAAEKKIWLMTREQQRIQKTLNSAPPPEYVRFRKAAERAAMPYALTPQ